MADRIHKPRCVNVLEALMRGHVLKINGQEYLFDGAHNLCIKGKNLTTGKEVFIKVSFGDVNLSEFVGWCDRIHPTEYEHILVDLAFDAVIHPCPPGESNEQS